MLVYDVESNRFSSFTPGGEISTFSSFDGCVLVNNEIYFAPCKANCVGVLSLY